MLKVRLFTSKNDLTEGIFGQGLIWVLAFLDAHPSLKPGEVSFDGIDTRAYGNLFPNLIVPSVQHGQDFGGVPINLKEEKLAGRVPGFNLTEESYLRASKIFHAWFRIPRPILDLVPSCIGKETLGIHYRGTDKLTCSQGSYISPPEFIKMVQEFLDISPFRVSSVWLTSDSSVFEAAFERAFRRSLPVYGHQQYRAPPGTETGWFRYGQDPRLQRHLASSAMVDMVGLSRCGLVIKTSSAFSSFPKILNPSQQVYTCSRMSQPWFPAAVVEPLPVVSDESVAVLERTMGGDAWQNEKFSRMFRTFG